MPWLSVTSYRQKNYCSKDQLAQVMDGSEAVRMAVTNPLQLSEGDVIMFEASLHFFNFRKFTCFISKIRVLLR